jgi:hypothetical protein
MAGSKSIVAALIGTLLTTACGNTVYGPRRLIQGGYVDDGDDVVQRHCPAERPSAREVTPINLTYEFHDRACDSLRDPGDPTLAGRMMDAGITLNRMRCNDFFAERAGNQTRERILRGTIAPVSALITGIIGIVDFDTDAGRQEAIQILGIGESATIAGLELYESEFLFGAANVNSVRTLTMRAADEHAAGILAQSVGFYTAARHLIDHQMICTPANILELAQAAIREGRIAPATRIRGDNAFAGGSDDEATISLIGASLQAADLTADQLGSLWWLSELVKAGGTISQDVLAVIHARLDELPVNPVSGTTGAFTVDTARVRQLTPLLDQLSTDVTSGFMVTKGLLDTRIAAAAPSSVLDPTSDVHFSVPVETIPIGRAVEVGIQPAATPQD